MSRPATAAELRAAYDASTFGRTMTFEQALAASWSRAALELGARLLCAARPAHVDISAPRPSRYAQEEATR